MAALTEAQRERLKEFRREKTRQRIWDMRRKLILLLALVGLSATCYVQAADAQVANPLPIVTSLWF